MADNHAETPRLVDEASRDLGNLRTKIPFHPSNYISSNLSEREYTTLFANSVVIQDTKLVDLTK